MRFPLIPPCHHIHIFQSHDQATIKAGFECPPWYSPPAARTRSSCQGQRETIRTQGWRADSGLSPGSPRAKTAGGFSVPLGLEWHRKDPNLHRATR